MKYVLSIILGFFGVMSSAIAAVPAGVTTALADLATDTVVIAAAAFAVFIGILAFTYYRRAAK